MVFPVIGRSPVLADLGVRGVTKIAVVLKASGYIEVETLDAGNGVIGSEEWDEEFDELSGGVPVEILSQRCVGGTALESRVESIEQFVVMPLHAGSGAQLAARYPDDRSICLGLQNLSSGIARCKESGVEYTVDNRRGVAASKWVDCRLRIRAGQRRIQRAVVESVRGIDRPIVVPPGSSVRVEYPVTPQFHAHAECAFVIFRAAIVVFVRPRIVEEGIVNLLAQGRTRSR